MKRTIVYIFCLSMLLGCERDNYRLTLSVDGMRVFDYSFKADTHDKAKEIAVEYINTEYAGRETEYLGRKVKLRLCSIEEPTWSWSVPDDDAEYFYPEPTPNILKEQKAYMKKEGKKAYAGALFGMPPSEVARLPHFKHYIRRGNTMYCYDEQIGNQYYNVTLIFGKDSGLYKIEFVSRWFKYDKEEYYLNDFMSVIETTYGPPVGVARPYEPFDFETGQMNPEYYQKELERFEKEQRMYVAHAKNKLRGGRWVIGEKYIDIFTEEDKSGRIIVHGRMVDKELETKYRMEEIAAKEENRKESSSLF